MTNLFTEEWALEQQAKAERGWKDLDKLKPDVSDDGFESALQSKAQKWMDDRGFPWIHDRSRGKNRPGQILDFYCFLPGPRIVIIEFKVAGKKMSAEQKETYLKLMQLGFEVHEVRSFKRFLEIVCRINQGNTARRQVVPR